MGGRCVDGPVDGGRCGAAPVWTVTSAKWRRRSRVHAMEERGAAGDGTGADRSDDRGRNDGGGVGASGVGRGDGGGPWSGACAVGGQRGIDRGVEEGGALAGGAARGIDVGPPAAYAPAAAADGERAGGGLSAAAQEADSEAAMRAALAAAQPVGDGPEATCGAVLLTDPASVTSHAATDLGQWWLNVHDHHGASAASWRAEAAPSLGAPATPFASWATWAATQAGGQPLSAAGRTLPPLADPAHAPGAPADVEPWWGITRGHNSVFRGGAAVAPPLPGVSTAPWVGGAAAAAAPNADGGGAVAAASVGDNWAWWWADSDALAGTQPVDNALNAASGVVPAAAPPGATAAPSGAAAAGSGAMTAAAEVGVRAAAARWAVVGLRSPCQWELPASKRSRRGPPAAPLADDSAAATWPGRLGPAFAGDAGMGPRAAGRGMPVSSGSGGRGDGTGGNGGCVGGGGVEARGGGRAGHGGRRGGGSGWSGTGGATDDGGRGGDGDVGIERHVAGDPGGDDVGGRMGGDVHTDVDACGGGGGLGGNGGVHDLAGDGRGHARRLLRGGLQDLHGAVVSPGRAAVAVPLVGRSAASRTGGDGAAAEPTAAATAVASQAGAASGAAAGGASGRVKCDECSREYLSRYTLARHVRAVHRNERPHKCCAPKCEASFSLVADLRLHVGRVHDEKRPEVCVHCGYRFLNNTALQGHVTAKHDRGPEHRVACRKCDKTCLRNENLRTHIWDVHCGVRRFACTVTGCEKLFVSSGKGQLHWKRCHANVPFPQDGSGIKDTGLLAPVVGSVFGGSGAAGGKGAAGGGTSGRGGRGGSDGACDGGSGAVGITGAGGSGGSTARGEAANAAAAAEDCGGAAAALADGEGWAARGVGGRAAASGGRRTSYGAAGSAEAAVDRAGATTALAAAGGRASGGDEAAARDVGYVSDGDGSSGGSTSDGDGSTSG